MELLHSTDMGGTTVSVGEKLAACTMFWLIEVPRGGGGYSKGVMGPGQPGYFFRDFCLKQGIEFISFFVLIRVSIY